MTRTVTHAEAAADESVQAGAQRAARSFAELCVRQAALEPSLATPARQMRWQLTLADAATGMGDVPLRGAHATNALVLAGRRAPRSSVAALLEGTGSSPRRAGLQDRSRRPAGERAVRPDGGLRHARVPADGRRVVLRERFAPHPLFRGPRAGPGRGGGRGPELSAGRSREIGAWFGFAGLGPLARYYFGQAFELAAREDDRSAEAHVHMVHSLYAVGRGALAGRSGRRRSLPGPLSPARRSRAVGQRPGDPILEPLLPGEAWRGRSGRRATSRLARARAVTRSRCHGCCIRAGQRARGRGRRRSAREHLSRSLGAHRREQRPHGGLEHAGHPRARARPRRRPGTRARPRS